MLQTIFLLLFALTLRGPSGGHCVELQFHPFPTYSPSMMILRGPFGGHCVGLQVYVEVDTLGALRVPSVW